MEYLEEVSITCLPGGRCQFIWTDELAEFAQQGDTTIKRASDVEPDDNGLWVADMAKVGGPKLPAQLLRSDALALEVQWLKDNYLGKEVNQ